MTSQPTLPAAGEQVYHAKLQRQCFGQVTIICVAVLCVPAKTREWQSVLEEPLASCGFVLCHFILQPPYWWKDRWEASCVVF